MLSAVEWTTDCTGVSLIPLLLQLNRVLEEKSKALVECVFVHVEGVPWSQSVWDSSGHRKLLLLLFREEVGIPRLEAELTLIFPAERGEGRKESGLRKERGRKRLRKHAADEVTAEIAKKRICKRKKKRKRKNCVCSEDLSSGDIGEKGWPEYKKMFKDTEIEVVSREWRSTLGKE